MTEFEFFTKMTRVYGYVRTSGEMNPVHSIYHQRCTIEEYAEQYGIKISKVFIDEMKTGTNQNREGFQELLSLIELNLIDLILVPFFDRLGRDEYEMSILLMKLKNKGIECISVCDGKYLSQMSETEIVQVAINAAEDNRVRRKRFANSQLSSVKKGEFAFNRPPFGYTKDQNRRLVPNEKAELVQLIFSKYLEFESIPKVVEHFKGKDKWESSLVLGYRNISDILRNKTYTGYIYTSLSTEGERMPVSNVKHPAIISEETFEKVQEVLERTIIKRKKPRKHNLTFVGVIFCSKCKKPMRGKNDRYFCVSPACRYGMYARNIDPLLLKFVLSLENISDFRELQEYKQEMDALNMKLKELDYAYARMKISKTRLKEKQFFLKEEINAVVDKYSKIPLYENSYTYQIENKKFQNLKELMLKNELKILVKKISSDEFIIEQM